MKGEVTRNKTQHESTTAHLVEGSPSTAVYIHNSMALTKILKSTSAEAIMRGVLTLVGYTFILIGGLTLLSGYTDTNVQNKLSALLCTAEDCVLEPATTDTTTSNTVPETTNTISEPATTTVVSTTPTEPVVQLEPKVQFFDIPATTKLNQNTIIAITIANAANPVVNLVSPTHGTITLVPLLREVDNRRLYTLPTATAVPGEYYVKVIVTALNKDVKAYFTSPHFMVPRPPVTDTVTETTTPTTESVATTEPVNTTIATSTKVAEPSSSTVATTTPILKPLTLQTKVGENPNTFQILAQASTPYERIELYLRNTASTQRTFLGVATKTSVGYIYWLDASRVPVGTYVVIAQGRQNTLVVETAEVKITTKAPVLTTEEVAKREADATTIKEALIHDATVPGEVDVLSVRKDYATTTQVLPVRTLSPATGTTTPIKTVVVTKQPIPPEEVLPQQEKARELLAERKERLNELFVRHASAVQTGDATVRKLAEEAISDEIRSLGQGADAETKAEIERAATVEIEKIKKKIEVTENILKVRTKDKSAVDTDKDGISDYDELTIYKTNPKDSDSDRDGVLDSVEIMRGFNPNDATTEAVINFASPKELGYVNESVLKVEKVVPVLNHDEATTSTPAVHSEIRGFALPNSFVTLYIFSTPTVVTLRTNSDGSFAYVFEKELEDGEHEVYVALTDNTGEIVVQSNPFSFVKTAQAFTYEDESVATVLGSEQPAVAPETSRTLMITIVMSIVALGVILVLLGQVLRTKRSDEPAW